MSRRVRAAIADDEPLARQRIRTLLEGEPDIDIVGESRDGRGTIALVEREAPDLLLLDIQMPGMDGFEVIERLAPKGMPVTIFVTAYDAYAIRAFEVHAFDYVLKPVDAERFREALGRAREQLLQEKKAAEGERLLAMLREARAAEAYPRRLAVRTGGKVIFVEVETIDWVEAADNYVRIHARGASHLLRGTISRLERMLDPRSFLRVHRSAIVNASRVRSLQSLFHGDSTLLLSDGTRLTVSQTYREKVVKALGHSI